MIRTTSPIQLLEHYVRAPIYSGEPCAIAAHNHDGHAVRYAKRHTCVLCERSNIGYLELGAPCMNPAHRIDGKALSVRYRKSGKCVKCQRERVNRNSARKRTG